MTEIYNSDWRRHLSFPVARRVRFGLVIPFHARRTSSYLIKSSSNVGHVHYDMAGNPLA